MPSDPVLQEAVRLLERAEKLFEEIPDRSVKRADRVSSWIHQVSRWRLAARLGP